LRRVRAPLEEEGLVSTAAGLPAFVAFALRPLPTGPLELVLQRLADSIVARHPQLIARMGGDSARCFGIEPLDLPFAVLIEVRDGAVRLSVIPRAGGLQVDARIAGTLLSLIELVNGRYDGDALFFSRDLVVEGDIGAVLALRNAIDNAELDLLHEAAQLAWPSPGVAEQIMRGGLAALAHLAGLGGSVEREASKERDQVSLSAKG
jgi:predicted lipid carrier protein YhbT